MNDPSFKESFEKFRPRIVYLFGLMFVASFFFAKGYYYNYKINIASYISFDDILFGYFVNIFLIGAFSVLALIIIFFRIIRDESNAEKKFKRLIRIIQIIAFSAIPLTVVQNHIANSISFYIISSVAVFMATLIYLNPTMEPQIDNTWLDEENDPEKKLIGWGILLGAFLFFTVFLAFVLGGYSKKMKVMQQFKIVLNDNYTITSSDSIKYEYVGNLSNYLFLYNPKTEESLIILKDNVKYFYLK